MSETRPPCPSFVDLLRVFTRIGLMSFGGPAAQIAVMQRELVEHRPWISETQFLNALSFCMLLPGPEAMQLCTYCGWRLRGWAGGLIAGLLFVLPGAAVMLAVALSYAQWGQLPLIESLFMGIKATVVIIVAQALFRLAGKTLKRGQSWLIAIASFCALYIFDTPFPAVIGAAALIGLTTAPTPTPDAPQPCAQPQNPGTTPTQTMRGLGVWLWGWLGLWGAPIGAAWIFGAHHLVNIGLFFSKLAVVSFGGAYAVLAYMAQEAVSTRNWLTPAQMMDGLGLAETTPGPLILVTEFVGFMAGFGLGGTGLAIGAAVMTLWVTFVPCFLWIFTAAPHVEWLTTRPRLNGALNAITAAVVGVIANLSLWFAIHVFFAHTTRSDSVFAPTLPVLNSLDPVALGLAGCAYVLLIRQKISLPASLCIMAGLSAAIATWGGS